MFFCLADRRMTLDRKVGSKDSFVGVSCNSVNESYFMPHLPIYILFVRARFRNRDISSYPSIFPVGPNPHSRACLDIRGFEVAALAAAPFFGWCHPSQGREVLATRSYRLRGPTSPTSTVTLDVLLKWALW